MLIHAFAGFLVLATARNVRTLDELATIGIRVFELDVTIQSNINQLKQTVHDEFGKLDVLVNNALATCSDPCYPVTDRYNSGQSESLQIHQRSGNLIPGQHSSPPLRTST